MLGLRTVATVAAIALPISAQAASDVSVAFELRDILDLRNGTGSSDAGQLERFYRNREGAVAWWTGGGWSPEARVAVKQLAASKEHGLNPADYNVEELRRLTSGAGMGDDPRSIAQAELKLTRAVLHYLNDVANGRIDPSTVGWEVNPTRRIDPPSALNRRLVGTGFESWLANVGPSSERYRRLKEARALYAGLVGLDWPHLSDGPTLREGDRGPRVSVVRRQLEMLEELRSDMTPVASQRPAPSPLAAGMSLASYDPAVQRSSESVDEGSRSAGNSSVYDSELASAVESFQASRGLRADGIVGPETREALNVTPDDMLAEIDLNLERLRWMSDRPGDRYILVNIPSYELEAYDGGAIVDRMNVVVGEPDWQTPIFSDRIVDLKFAPNWTIPQSIVEEETLPKVRRDPGYLRRSNIRVFSHGGGEVNPGAVNWHSASASSYVFRQDPGPRSALGLVRFSLTNSQGIYLHDTPHKDLFDRPYRALSHGCIRVERPKDLAEYLLEHDPSWDRGRIEEAMNAGSTNVHDLEQSTPVHLIYLTAQADDRGRLELRKDVYDRNGQLRQALERASAERQRTT